MSVLFLLNRPDVGFSEKVPRLCAKYKGANVILIIFDALRLDHLSCYGYNKQTCPNIDKLAREGVIFSNAFCQASITLPSVTSIFTSLYPYSHRLVYILNDEIPAQIDTLAEILNTYGYDTAWFGMLDDPHSGSAKGLLEGFNEKYNLTPFENPQGNEQVLSWLRGHRKASFFMTIHSYSTHEQFFPFQRFDNEFSRGIPKDFLDLLDTLDKRCWDNLQQMLRVSLKDAESILGGGWIEKNLNREYFPAAFSSLFNLAETLGQKIILERTRNKAAIALFESLDKKQIPYFLSLLDSAIYQIDSDIVGRLVEELRILNFYDKTIIIITADHGNLYGEHGKFGHGYYLYDEVMRVPLILRLPNLNKGRVVRELAQNIDILPTVLDLLSIPAPHQAQGISLAGLIKREKSALHNEYVFCEPRGNSLGPFAIRSKNWKLMQMPAQENTQINNVNPDKLEFQLFDLINDPYELDNLAQKEHKVVETLQSRLSSWMDSLVVYQQGENDFVPGLQEETKERIKNTGYW